MQTIDIRTTQNVTIEYELASLRERILAFIIDLLLIFLLYYILINVLNLFLHPESEILSVIGSQIFLFFFWLAYHLFSEILGDGQSWGKKIMGIKVVRLDGKEPAFSDYLLRVIFHFVDSFISLGIVATLLISSSGKNQRLGDVTANTSVIKVRHNSMFRLVDILKINTLEDYQPQYPEVKQLSEKDMLLIKSVIARQLNYANAAHDKAIQELVDRVCHLLEIAPPAPKDRIPFLKILIRDYIVLTR